jgi:pimeloyl-ACP methyl ester carboxylesterase
LLGAASGAFAQSDPLYIQFSPAAVKGALYKPNSGPIPHIAVLLTHRTSNFLSHLATDELSQRGFLVLAMNPRSDNNEAAVDFERNALDIRAGIEFLRAQPGISKVVLFGHSGGGPATSFYQAVAEQSPSYCQGADKLIECTADLDGLPSADGLILMDAHPGISVNALRSINPALLNDYDPRRLDPALDPFSPENGYNPGGNSSYSEEFKQRYFEAQADRMNRLIEVALDMLGRMQRDEYVYPDDDVFVVVRGTGAQLMQLDTSIHHGSLRPQKVLTNDGTVVTRIAESVRMPAPGLAESNGYWLHAGIPEAGLKGTDGRIPPQALAIQVFPRSGQKRRL